MINVIASTVNTTQHNTTIFLYKLFKIIFSQTIKLCILHDILLFKSYFCNFNKKSKKIKLGGKL